MRRLGSLFAGIGGLDLACEWALGCSTAWQLDLTGADVRRRHWPDALQVEADVATVDPLSLPRVDVICGGFACQDLSCAGKQASREELEYGARTGPTYLGLLRFVRALRPKIVVIENVPGLLAHQWRVERDFVGYGLTWVRCRALDAGAPHLRARVFVVARLGTIGRGIVDAPRDGACGVACEVRPWPTAAARDYRTGDIADRIGTPSLSQACSDYPRGTWGSRLNPAWVETLQGFPVGWTEPDGPGMECSPSPRWPRGRYPADWDHSVPWPGYDWEPSRTLPDGPPIPGRPARIRALGNAVVPQQGALALRCAL